MKSLLPNLVPIAIGAVLGGIAGHFGQCHNGTCPLTSTWWRGALYGAVWGLLWMFSSRHV